MRAGELTSLVSYVATQVRERCSPVPLASNYVQESWPQGHEIGELPLTGCSSPGRHIGTDPVGSKAGEPVLM